MPSEPKEHDWYDTFGDTRCRDCDLLVWDKRAKEPCPGDTIGPEKPFYWYPSGPRINRDPEYRGSIALCRFIFPGYVVPRREMARAVLEAAADERDDWMDRLPVKHVATGKPIPIIEGTEVMYRPDQVHEGT